MSKRENIIKRIVSIIMLAIISLSEMSMVGAAYNENRVTSSKYLVSEGNKYISRIEPETTLEEFRSYFNLEEHRLHIYASKESEEEVKDGYIKTGMVLKCDEIEDIYDLVVIGDINGDGLMSQVDLNILIKHVIGYEEGQLEGIQAVAADILYDRKINQIDITTLIRYIVYHELPGSEIKRPGKPEIEVVQGEAGEEEWYRSEVVAKITQDKKSEVKIDKTMYQIAGKGEETKVGENGEIVLIEEGEHQILAYSYSIDGAKSEIASKTVKIDKTSPEAKVEAVGNNKKIEVKVKATDELSGIKEYVYYIKEKKTDGSTTWSEGAASSKAEYRFENLVGKEYEVKVEVKDKAGNVTQKIEKVHISNIPELVDDKKADKDKEDGVENPRESNVTVEKSEEEWTNKDVIIKVELDEEVDPEHKYELEYSKDGGETWEPYDPEKGIVVEENTDVEIRLTDGEEHGEGITIPVTNIDKTAPTLEIDTKPSSNKIEVHADAKDEGSGIKEYVYYIGEKKEDGSIEWKVGIPSDKPDHTFERLEQGKEYEIKVEVKDKAGNVTTKQKTETTEKIPELVDDKKADKDKEDGVENPREPNITIEKSEEEWTNKDVVVKVELDEEADPEHKYELEYSKDKGETWEPYDPEKGIVVEENTDVEIRLTDGEEHGEGITIPVTNIDKTAPTLEIKTEATAKTIKVHAEAKDEGSGIKEYVYYIGEKQEDGSIEWKEGIPSDKPDYTFEGLEQGKEYEIKVEVKDKAGNTAEKQKTQKTSQIPELVDDKKADKDKEDGVENPREPNITVEKSEEEWTNKDVVIKVELDETVDPEGKYELEYSKDKGETWEPYDPEQGIVVEENTDVEIRLTDGEEHGEGITIPVTNIDKTAPTASVEAEGKRTSIEVEVTAEDDLSGIKEYVYYIGKEQKDGTIKWEEGITSTDPNHIFEGLEKETEYKIKVEVKDKAGNVAVLTTSAETIDGIDTSKYIKMTPNTRRWTHGNVIVTISENSITYDTEYSLDGKTWTKFDGEQTIEMTENGTIYARIKNEQEIGDIISLTVGNIDKQKPVAKIVPIEITSKSIQVKLESEDNLSGIAQIRWKHKIASKETYDEETYNYVPVENTITGKMEISKEFLYEELIHGNYWVCAEVTDAAGNVTTTDVEIVDPIEVTAGKDGIQFDANKNWTNENVVVTIESKDSRYQLLTSIDGKNFLTQNSYELEQNGTIYAKLTDGINYGEITEYIVGNIDKQEAEAKININEITSKSFRIDLHAEDNLSGIGKVEWFYKNSASETYEKETIDLVELKGEQAGNLQEDKQLHVDNLERGVYIIYAKVYDVAGNEVETEEIRLELEEITKGEDVLTFTPNNTNWTNEDVEITVTNTDNRYTIQTSDNGVDWKDSNKVIIKQNGDAIARLTDGVNYGQTARSTINNIDKTAATASLQSAEITSKTMQITATITDDSSGLSKIDWYYRLKGLDEYTHDVQNYQTLKGAEAGELHAQKSITYENLKSGTYEIYAVVTDVAGNETVTDTIEVTLLTIIPGSNGITITSSNENWTNEDVEMTAKSTDERYTVQTSKDGKTYQDAEKVTYEANGTIYARLTDGINAGLPVTREITNIDKEAAEVNVEVDNVTSRTFTQTINITDNSSGLSKIQLYYRQKGETEYKVKEIVYQTMKGPVAGETNTSKNIEIENLVNGTYETYVVITDVAGNTAEAEDSTKENPKEVTLEKITSAEEGLTLTPSTRNWTNDHVVVTVTNTDTRYEIQTKKSDETEWTALKEVDLYENATIEARLYDGINGGETSSITITNIDKTKPTGTIECTGVTTKTMDLKVTADDSSSGIGQITWYYKKDGESTFQSKTVSYQTINGAVAGDKHVEETQTFEEIPYGKYTAYAVITDVAGNVTATSQIEFTLEQMPSAIGEITLTPSITTYTNGNVIVTANSTNTEFMMQTSIDGSNWTSDTEHTITENRTVYGRLYDGVNGGESATLTITNIDKTAPQARTITYTPSGTTLDLRLAVTDDISGIAKVVWYYKHSSASTYTSSATTFVAMNGANQGNLSQTLTKQITGLVAGESYHVYAEIYDVAGNMQTTSTITALTNRAPVIQSVNYSTKSTNSLTITARATDADGDNLKYTLYTSTSQNSGYTAKGTANGASGTTVTLQATGLNEYTVYYYYVVVTDNIATVESGKGNNQRTYCPGNAYSCSGSTNYCSGSTTTCSGNTYTCTSGYTSTVNCSSCSGSGKKDCSHCGGHGVWSCGTCGGSKTVTCTKCSGSGTIACTGSMDVLDPGGISEDLCPNCEKGYMDWTRFGCRICGVDTLYWSCTNCTFSTGSSSPSHRRISCTTCGGSKKVNCSHCNGTGRVTCTYCRGSKTENCSSCNGKGTTTTSRTCSHGYTRSHGYCGHGYTSSHTYYISCYHGVTGTHSYCGHGYNGTSHRYCSHGRTYQHDS